jgi:hypothetical protein
MAHPSPAAPALHLAIDHVAFASRDLDAAQDRLAVLGLSHTPVGEARWPEPEGPHRARSLSVMVEGGYLDVIELPTAPEVLRATGVVLATSELLATRDRLVAAGVRCGRPYTIVRCFEGAASDQYYEIFGIDARHACGLPQSVLATREAPRMQNRTRHSARVGSLADAARLLGVELYPSTACLRSGASRFAGPG